MGKTEYCTNCLHFYREKHDRRWGSSKRVVEIPGCAKCQERHGEQTHKLDAQLKALQQDFDWAKERHEEDLTKLKEESRLDSLKMTAEHQQLNARLSFEMNDLKADNSDQRSKIEFLKIRRECNQGDVVIAVSDSEILAHQTILAQRSPVFQLILRCYSSLFRDAKGRPLIKVIENLFPPPVLEAIVDFCYSGDITFSELVPPHEIIKAAHTFELEYLSKLSEAELCRRLTVENVPQMLKLARDFNALRLQDEAGKLFKEHFEILSGKVYEVLQGPSVSTSASLLVPPTSPKLDEKSHV